LVQAAGATEIGYQLMVVPKAASATPGAVNPTGVMASITVAVQGRFALTLSA